MVVTVTKTEMRDDLVCFRRKSKNIILNVVLNLNFCGVSRQRYIVDS